MIPLPLIQVPPVPESALLEPGRICGKCKECCTVLGVDEVDKANFEPCKHLCEKGCGIYETRPADCRKWYCLWRMRFGMSRFSRPDLLGVIVDLVQMSDDGQLAYRFWECRPGAIDRPEVHKELGKLLARHPSLAFVVPYGFPWNRKSIRQLKEEGLMEDGKLDGWAVIKLRKEPNANAGN